MNACPCGYHGDPRRECRCSVKQIEISRNRVSGLRLDRIDLHVEVASVSFRELQSLGDGHETSAAISVATAGTTTTVTATASEALGTLFLNSGVMQG